MELSAQSIEQLYALKHRFLHFVQTSTESQTKAQLLKIDLEESQQLIPKLKHDIDQLQIDNFQLNLQLKQAIEREQNYLHNNHKLLSNNTSLSQSMLNNHHQPHQLNNNGESSSTTLQSLQNENEQLKQQLETLKTSHSEQKRLNLSIQLENDKYRKDLELLKIKNEHITTKLTTIETNTMNTMDEMNKLVAVQCNNFAGINKDFASFLSSYQTNYMKTTKDSHQLHINIDQLNTTLESKLKLIEQYENELFTLQKQISGQDNIIYEQKQSNQQLQLKYDNLMIQHKHNLNLLQSVLTAQTNANIVGNITQSNHSSHVMSPNNNISSPMYHNHNQHEQQQQQQQRRRGQQPPSHQLHDEIFKVDDENDVEAQKQETESLSVKNSPLYQLQSPPIQSTNIESTTYPNSTQQSNQQSHRSTPMSAINNIDQLNDENFTSIPHLEVLLSDATTTTIQQQQQLTIDTIHEHSSQSRSQQSQQSQQSYFGTCSSMVDNEHKANKMLNDQLDDNISNSININAETMNND